MNTNKRSSIAPLRASFWLSAGLSLLALILFGCGKTPPPKNPKDVAGGGGGGGDQLVDPPKKPKRKLSGEAKTEFLAAVKKYKAAKKAGLKDSCDSVASAFADVYSEHPKVVEAKFNEGVVWEECGDEGKAEKIYQEILAKHPKHGPSYNNLGQIYMRRGQPGQALNYFQKAAAQKNSEGYANLAMIQRGRALNGDTQSLREAVNNIHRALAVDSFNIEAYNLLATLLYDHARTRSQLEMTRLIGLQATKVESDYAPVYNVLGLVMLKQGRVTPALAQFRKAIQYNPNFVEALMNIGAITLSFRDYATAERSFRKVLGLTKDKSVKFSATVGLGVALRGQRKFDEAMTQYKAAEKIRPDASGDVAYNKGILIQDYTFDASDPQKGIDTLNKARGLLQQYLSSGKDKSQARDARRRIKNIKQMVKALREQQKMMEEMKRMQEKQKKQGG